MALYDFSGYATKNDLKCADGRTIRRNAFIENDGKVVPLVWQHFHDDPDNVLGHALLENREDGVYAYCSFNETDAGKRSKLLVEHGDITALSIYANKLKHNGSDVVHGLIREVSLVLSGANPGATIDTLAIEHSEDSENEEVIARFYQPIEIYHSDKEEPAKETKKEEEKPMAETKEKTVKDVFDELTEEQKNVVYYMIGQALEDAGVKNDDNDEEEKEVKHSDLDEGDDFMKHNVFDAANDANNNVLTHSDMEAIFTDAKRCGSLKESVLQHSANEWGIEYGTDSNGKTVNPSYGVANIDYLFPEARLEGGIQYITRRTNWVSEVMNSVHRSPISRIKSIFADLTPEEARAKGYIKGNMKKEQVFGLLKRVTTPTTVYKKQKLDRDDVVDIVDFDIVAELKTEMRLMLDEEIARAILIGDGRSTSSADKISETNIRPIWTDADLYTIKHEIALPANATAAQKADALVDASVVAMDSYEGSGSPVMYAPQQWVTQMLLLKDTTGHRIYKDLVELAAAMCVRKIVPIADMNNQTRSDDEKTYTLGGLIVNLADYSVGADKGGSVNMFDDFDIDYNQMKYLIETRCSGTLTKPHSAIALEFTVAA